MARYPSYILSIIFIFSPILVQAQFGSLGGSTFGNLSNIGTSFSSAINNNGEKSGNKSDSLQERDFEAEKIRVRYRNIFDVKYITVADSAFNPKREQFDIPYGYNPLSNFGNAMYPYVFDMNTYIRPGLNLDISPYRLYKTQKKDIQLYSAERPFGSLGYLIGSKQQQILSGSYTQNFTPDLNFFLDYKFMNSPGYFKNQNANNSNLSLGLHYHTHNQKYELIAFYIRSNVVSNENGGVPNDSFITGKDEVYVTDRSTIPVVLGNAIGYNSNPFNLTLNKGRREKINLLHITNTYNIGRRNSFLSKDSVSFHVFIPRFIISHTFEYETQSFAFTDNTPMSDSTFYATFYPSIPSHFRMENNLFRIEDKWQIIRNTFTLRYFPKKGNLYSYWEGKTTHEHIRDSFYFNTLLPAQNHFNFFVEGVLNTHIRKIKSNIKAYGTYYLAGLNKNNAELGLSLEKKIVQKWGNIQFEAQWIRTTPTYFFRHLSAFNKYRIQEDYQTMNYITASLNWQIPRINLDIQFRLQNIKNIVWQNTYDKNQQFPFWISIPQIEITKLFHFFRHFYFFTRSTLQPSVKSIQTTTGKPFSDVIQLPLWYSVNQIYYENVFFKTLRLVTGFEIRYNTPFKAPRYNPIYTSFVYQNTTNLSNIPQVHFFAKARIRNRFSISWRLENLNTMTIIDKALRYSNNNFVILNQPLYELSYQLGIVWDFVN